MNNKIEVAIQKFNSGFNCAQSVLFAYSDDVNIERDTALKIAWGFGAGMGRKQEVCGAVTGGIIAIGAKHGDGQEDKQAATDEVYSKTRELMDKFRVKHGTFICLELLDGCNLMTEKGRRYFNESNLKDKVCNGCVKDVVKILEDIL